MSLKIRQPYKNNYQLVNQNENVVKEEETIYNYNKDTGEIKEEKKIVTKVVENNNQNSSQTPKKTFHQLAMRKTTNASYM